MNSELVCTLLDKMCLPISEVTIWFYNLTAVEAEHSKTCYFHFIIH